MKICKLLIVVNECIVCVASISPLPNIILRRYWKYRNCRSSSLAWTLKKIVHRGYPEDNYRLAGIV